MPVSARLGRRRERPHSLSRDPLVMRDSKITVFDWCTRDDPIWGRQHGREGLPRDATVTPFVPVACIDAALRQATLGRFTRSVHRNLAHAVHPRYGLIWFWRGSRWRLRRFADALAHLGSHLVGQP